MPLYEYQCKACGHRFEKIQKFSDEPIRECPQCHKKEVEKLISAPAVQFKGDGWYVTDYARKNASGAKPTSETSSGSTSASSSESKSESKSETKTESKPAKKDSKKH